SPTPGSGGRSSSRPRKADPCSKLSLRPQTRYIRPGRSPSEPRVLQGTISRIVPLGSSCGVCCRPSLASAPGLPCAPTKCESQFALTFRFRRLPERKSPETQEKSVVPALSDHLARATLQARFFRSRRIRTSVGRMHVLDARGRGRLPPLVL